MNYNKHLLARLVQDCDYYLGYGARNPKHLWALSERPQIKKIRELYQKPEWLTIGQLAGYERDLCGGNYYTEVCRAKSLKYLSKHKQFTLDLTMRINGFWVLFRPITKVNYFYRLNNHQKKHLFFELFSNRLEMP